MKAISNDSSTSRPALRIRSPIMLASLAIVTLMHTKVMAHHSTSIYDREAPVSIEGTIVEYEWRNPHVYLYLEQELTDGGHVIWEVEAQPPAILRRMGWTQETVKQGDRVTVHGIAGRDATKKIALMESLEQADDKVLSISSQHVMTSLSQEDAATIRQARGFDGTWATLLDLDTIGPFISPSSLDVTAKGQEAIDSFVETQHSPALSCIAFPAPQLMATPDIKHIEVRDDMVIIRSEFDAAERRIYLNTDSHEGASESVQGHSIGRWDAGALVIDTTHFTPHRTGIAGGLPSGSGKHLTERLALNEDATHLVYSFELKDPEYLASPFTGSGVLWSWRPDLAYEAVECSIDNARRFAE